MLISAILFCVFSLFPPFSFYFGLLEDSLKFHFDFLYCAFESKFFFQFFFLFFFLFVVDFVIH